MSRVASNDTNAWVCAWCRRQDSSVFRRSRRRFCGRKCRQAAFRLRRHACRNDDREKHPGTFTYADPPYPGTSAKYYRGEPTFAGEVDFPALIRSLEDSRDAGTCLGWALSTSAKSLRALLPLCPAEARVCAWVKPIGASPRTFGIHNTWEPVIVVPGRPPPTARKTGLATRDAGPWRRHAPRPQAHCLLRLALRAARHGAGRHPRRPIPWDRHRGARVDRAVVKVLNDTRGRCVVQTDRRLSPTAGGGRQSSLLEETTDGPSSVDEHDARSLRPA